MLFVDVEREEVCVDAEGAAERGHADIGRNGVCRLQGSSSNTLLVSFQSVRLCSLASFS